MTDLGIAIHALREEAAFPRVPLPSELETAYGAPLRLPDQVVYANFVSSVDGVAAIAGVQTSSALISGGAASDRFVMALLRSAADAVIVGSGTLREHEGPWTAEHAFPRAAEQFARARSDAAAAPAPRLIVTTRTGDLPVGHPALVDALVASTSRGVRSTAERSAGQLDVLDLGAGEQVDPTALIDALHERGYRRILTEGGPGWMGSMLAAGAVDQLFLTLSPKLLGGGDGHAPLSGDRDLLDLGRDLRVLGIRISADHLFLRYAVR